MEFGLNLGGITLIAIAVIWLVFFIPSWTQRNEHIALEQSIASERTSIPDSIAQRANRLQRTRSLFAIAFAFFFMGALASFIAIASSVGFLFLGLGLLTISLLSMRVSKAASSALAAILDEIANARSLARSRQATSRSRSWTPNPLPKPLIGEQPVSGEVANPDVIQLSQRKQLRAFELDEIMARRRAI